MKNQTNIEYEKRLVAFIDILGFRELVKKSEHNPAILENLYQAINYLKNWEKPDSWNLSTIEIEEDAQKKGVSLFTINDKSNCTCFSDSIVVSVRVADSDINAIFSTLVANISLFGANIIQNGILIRGAITIGNLIHKDNGIIIGQGLIDAYNLESKLACFPRIIISDNLIKELNYPLSAKRERYPYHQYLVRDNDGCVGFHQLKYFEVVQSWTEMKDDILKTSLNNIRKEIIKGLDSTFETPSAHGKYQWLKDQYNKLIILSDFDFETKTEENIKQKIRELNDGISRHNIHYSYTDDFYSSKK